MAEFCHPWDKEAQRRLLEGKGGPRKCQKPAHYTLVGVIYFHPDLGWWADARGACLPTDGSRADLIMHALQSAVTSETDAPAAVGIMRDVLAETAGPKIDAMLKGQQWHTKRSDGSVVPRTTLPGSEAVDRLCVRHLLYETRVLDDGPEVASGADDADSECGR